MLRLIETRVLTVILGISKLEMTCRCLISNEELMRIP